MGRDGLAAGSLRTLKQAWVCSIKLAQQIQGTADKHRSGTARQFPQRSMDIRRRHGPRPQKPGQLLRRKGARAAGDAHSTQGTFRKAAHQGQHDIKRLVAQAAEDHGGRTDGVRVQGGLGRCARRQG